MNIKTNLIEEYVNFVDTTKKQNRYFERISILFVVILSLFLIFLLFIFNSNYCLHKYNNNYNITRFWIGVIILNCSLTKSVTNKITYSYNYNIYNIPNYTSIYTKLYIHLYESLYIYSHFVLHTIIRVLIIRYTYIYMSRS